MNFLNKNTPAEDKSVVESEVLPAADSLVGEIAPAGESIVGTADISPESIVVSQTNVDFETEFSKPEKKKGGGFLAFFKKKPKEDLFHEPLIEGSLADVEQVNHAEQSAQQVDSFTATAETPEYPEVATSFAAEAEQGAFDDVMDPTQLANEQAIDAHALSEDREAEIIREIGTKPQTLPVIGKLPAKTQYALSFGLLVASLALSGGLAGAGFLGASQYQGRTEVGTRIEMLTQRVVATSQFAIAGSREASEQLRESRDLVAEQLDALLKGNKNIRGMSATDSTSLATANTLLTNDILPLVDQMVALSNNLAALTENSTSLNKSAYSLYVSAEQLVTLLQANGSPEIHVSAADHIRVLSERLRRNGAQLLTSTEVSIEPLAEYNADFRNLRATLDSLTKGDATVGMAQLSDPQAIAIVDGMKSPLIEIAKVTEYVEKNAPALVTARRNLKTLTVKSEDALKAATQFSSEMRDISQAAYSKVYLSAIFVVAALASLALIGLVNNRSTRMEAWESAFKNKRNEKDIIDFMEACLPLEMGDLTVRFNENMQAMEGVTGGIRNSVNEAVLSLNEAVGTVKQTAEDVSYVVTEAVDNTNLMKVSNERQAQEITDVESRVANLGEAIDQVTEKTLEAARATQSAREASEEGVRVVSQTNEKMGQIRANMQEVLKSVKHLGETSQEIGAIVNTIDQITDRTQVLAVNASLEAAKAGAAGAGFQIIAGEVNRLAEQSAEALKTITALVQRVQGETSVTIRVVEESTENVVAGARLSEVANTQLDSISKLTLDLSTIMEEIRAQSANQSSNAKQVRESMERLATLSREFQTQVSQVVGGVQQIDASMGSLKSTVAIFTTESAEEAA